MTLHITDLFASPVITPAPRYFWDPGRDEANFVNSNWPLPENFAYTNAQLLTGGTDGLPVGDLNYFPDAKATFLANQAQYVKQIEDMVSAPVLNIILTKEAETATTAGDVTIFVVQGFTYFQMDGSGMIQWVFDLPQGGQYDLNVWTHMRNNPQRGQHTFINGTEIHDASHGWGELIYDNAQGVTTGMPIDAWTWVRWTQADLKEAGALTFLTGQNSIKITPSWGWQNFAGIDLLEPGTNNVVKSLRATDANFEGVTPHAEGAPWTPSYFKAATLNAGGSVSVSVDAPDDASYMMRFFYAAAGTAQASIAVDGTEVIPSVAFTDTSDVFSPQFVMTKGTHTITVASAAGGVTIDYLQVIEFVPVGVNQPKELPLGYYLQQNYPNPFNPTTSVDFAIGKASNVKLTVYNVLGQTVATLVDGRMSAGAHTVMFNASNLSSGVYFYRIEAGDFKLTKRMVLLK